MSPDRLSRLDPGDMYGAIRSFPQQLRDGREIAGRIDPEVEVEDIGAVVIAGMGGSAIGGDLVAAMALAGSPVPVTVSRSYTLPGFVTEDTLVVISSYSGNTEETLSAMDDAAARGARLICITSGGEVLQRAEAEDLVCYKIPGGMQPRAALGYSFSTLLTMAGRIGIVSLGDEAWEETLTLLDQQGAALASLDGNPARDLAQTLQGRLPFVYSGGGLLAPVVTRWCGQISENAKVLAHGNVLPEQNHNEIVGWEVETALHSEVAVIALRDRMEHPRIAKRLELTRDLLQDRAASWSSVESRGASDLARILSLVQFGDWVSFHLALIRGVDPTPVHLIDRLKQAL